MTKDLIKHSNLTVVERREFVRLPNALNEKQLQLLLLLVAQVKEADTEYNWIHIKYDDLIEMYNKNVYDKKSIKSMKDMILDLSKKQWKIQTDTREYFGHYIDCGMFDDVNRTIDLKLSNETIYFFLKLDGNGLVSSYKYIRQLHTKCAIQLYRWANVNKNFKNHTVNINIEKAIKLFYDDDKTIKVNDFFRKHLEPAIDRINCLTDLHVEYEKIKADKDNKRKISSLKFTIYERDKYEKDILNDDYEDCEISDYDYFNDL